MSYLSLYFLIKVGLYYSHVIGFHWLLNLLLALAALWPVAHAGWQRARRWLVWPLAIALLYHDSYLPTPERAWSQVANLRGFSADYMAELVHRFLSPSLLIGLVLLVLAYTLLSRWVRFATLALAGIVSVPLVAALNASEPSNAGGTVAAASTAGATTSAAPAAGNYDAQLQAFYASESQRRLVFPKQLGAPPFDLIVLHVCSMSWDDLDVVNERNNPFLKRFDAVFTHFNSAASYSGPATYRIFRGNCGQEAHAKLYQGVDADCYTFPALEKAGYQTRGLLNHNGIFDGFAKIVEHEAGLVGHMESNKAGTVQMQSFDGTPVYDDYGLLSQWWTQRLQKGTAPVALYYNTISLHDGNRLPGVTRNSLETYKPRVTKLLSDFDRFVSQIEASGRPVVVMLVPEHGASLRGDKLQVPGVREIPDPKITIVPAAIKIIGLPGASKAPSTGPVVVNQDISYFGINTLLADLLRDSPFAPNARPLAQRLDALETTAYVAENDDVVMLRTAAGGYVMKAADGTWIPYDK